MPTTKTTPTELAAQINKALGAGSISLGSDPQFQVTYIPTGVLAVDVILQGGIPRGRITELYGSFSSLKSYLGLCTIASTQQSGGTAVLVDTEHSFDPAWADYIGVDTAALLLQQPHTGEEAVDAVQVALAGHADLVVWDSIAATQPRDEASVQLSGKKNIQPARLAALMSVALRRLNSTNRNTALLCINQTRQKVGIVFGSPETTPGGRSLPFYASYRVSFNKAGRVTRPRQVWDGDELTTVHEVTQQRIRLSLTKSKLSRPEREDFLVWDLEDKRVDDIGYLIGVGVEHGLIKTNKVKGRPQAWTVNGETYKTTRQFRGYLTSSPDMIETLTKLAWDGIQADDSKKEGRSRSKSSSRSVPGRTRTPEQAPSRTTGRRKKQTTR